MITEKDLHEAIAECQGVRNPNANTCLKLASFYTILDHMTEQPKYSVQYSYDAGPVERFGYVGDSEFLQSVQGMNTSDVMGLMDELMSTLQVMQPKLYNGVMRKIKGAV